MGRNIVVDINKPMHRGSSTRQFAFLLLSNIVLNELDNELEGWGHKFVRYTDNCNIYVPSQEEDMRVMESISNFIESKLKLHVNREKSQIWKGNQIKSLGHTIENDGA